MRFQANVITILRGNAEQFPVFLLDENGRPSGINGAVSISLRLTNQDDTILEKAAFIGNAYGYQDPLYIYGFQLTPTETSLLKLGRNLPIHLSIGFGSYIQTFVIPRGLTIQDV